MCHVFTIRLESRVIPKGIQSQVLMGWLNFTQEERRTVAILFGWTEISTVTKWLGCLRILVCQPS